MGDERIRAGDKGLLGSKAAAAFTELIKTVATVAPKKKHHTL